MTLEYKTSPLPLSENVRQCVGCRDECVEISSVGRDEAFVSADLGNSSNNSNGQRHFLDGPLGTSFKFVKL